MANNSATAKTKKAASKAAPKAATKASVKDDKTMLKELFVDELRDIYWAEKHITKALPKMAKGATSTELVNAFQEHLTVTEGQIGRVEQVFEQLNLSARAKKCEAMEGLV